jgi:beta-galactosidase/beta-glucuronidase
MWSLRAIGVVVDPDGDCVAVVDEANIETHGMKPMGRISADPYWRHAYVDRISRMVLTNKNCPCIIIWSLGNESGDGANLVAGREWVKAYDTSRPVQYESGGESCVPVQLPPVREPEPADHWMVYRGGSVRDGSHEPHGHRVPHVPAR